VACMRAYGVKNFPGASTAIKNLDTTSPTFEKVSVRCYDSLLRSLPEAKLTRANGSTIDLVPYRVPSGSIAGYGGSCCPSARPAAHRGSASRVEANCDRSVAGAPGSCGSAAAAARGRRSDPTAPSTAWRPASNPRPRSPPTHRCSKASKRPLNALWAPHGAHRMRRSARSLSAKLCTRPQTVAHQQPTGSDTPC